MADSLPKLSKDERTIFSLGVNNRVLPPTRFSRKLPPQDDRLARYGGPYARRKLQMPKFLEVLKQQEEKWSKKEYTQKHTLASLVPELFYSVCEYLDRDCLQQLCLVSKPIYELAWPTLYVDFSPAYRIAFEPENKEDFFKYCQHPKAGVWKEWSLQLYWYYFTYKEHALQKITDHFRHLNGVERLVLKAGFEFTEDDRDLVPFIAEDLEIQLAKSPDSAIIFGNLTTLVYGVTNPHSVRIVLSQTKKLTHLTLYFHGLRFGCARKLIRSFNGWDDVTAIVAEEVGQNLRFYATDVGPRYLDPEKQPFQALASREKFPQLEFVRIGTDFFVWDEDDRRGLKQIKIMMQLCEASLSHGGWITNEMNWAPNIYQFASLEYKEASTLVQWLSTCSNDIRRNNDNMKVGLQHIHTFKGGESIHRPFNQPSNGYLVMTDEVFDTYWKYKDNTSTLSEALKKVMRICSIANIPLKLRLEIHRPRWNTNEQQVREKIWKPIGLSLHSLHIFPTASPDWEDQHYCMEDWVDFFDDFLPLCRNLVSFRIEGARLRISPVFVPSKHSRVFYNLVKDGKLREFDIDMGALIQPATCPDLGPENPPQLGADVQEPRAAIKQVMWMSIPNDPGKHLMLQNLTRLTLRNLFVYRQIEMTWVGNLTAKLKQLEVLEFIGLVWAVGYDPDDKKRLKYKENDTGGEANDDDDDTEEDADNSDVLKDGALGGEGHVEGRTKEDKEAKGKEKATGETPEAPTVAAVGSTPGPSGRKQDADSNTNPGMVQDIETQFTKFNLGENNELTHKTPHDDGLLAWLPDKDLRTAPPSPDPSDSDSNPDSENDDASSTKSSSSARSVFGSDPRFSDEVNIQLRIERHRQWLIRVLIQTAIQTGGRCRDVRITDMKLNGAGQRAWDFDKHWDADLDPFGWGTEDDDDDESDEDYDDDDDFLRERAEEGEWIGEDWADEDDDDEIDEDEDEDDDVYW
ncbi:hypothetical protein BDZ91DRAFT_845698 [Kalaharituber pfeilii]|nr:hypothetical protein BDZ91DRAFT_845698 [Kalaharituber pfeilii]